MADKVRADKRREKERQLLMKIPEKVKHLKEKSQKKDIERRQQAKKDRDYLNQCKAAGVRPKALQKPEATQQAAGSGNPPNLLPEDAKSKIEEVTARLSKSKESQKQMSPYQARK